MKYRVFISYSRKDTEVAERVCRQLDAAGISYFIDNGNIRGSEDFPDVISEAILDSELFLLLASQNSNESVYTKKEIVFATNHNTEILPYIIDGSSLPKGLELLLSNINWITVKSHPIETKLVPEILNVLDSPEAVRRHRKRKMPAYISAITVILVAVAFIFIVPVVIENTRERKARIAAEKDQAEYLSRIQLSDSLLTRAKSMSVTGEALMTPEEEIECYKTADSLLRSARRIKTNYSGTVNYGLFTPDVIDSKRSELMSSLDSIHSFWEDCAKNAIMLYDSGFGDSEKDNAIMFINLAQKAKYDPQLESLKNNLK